jgi:hypothetical protein
MGVPVSEVGYTSVTAGRGDHEVHKGHLVAFEEVILTDGQVNKKNSAYTVMCRITTFRSTTDRIYDGGKDLRSFI